MHITPTQDRTPTETDARFYPCYIDLNKIRSTVAFGWDGIYSIRSKFEGFPLLLNHLKSKSEITELFDNDKIRELTEAYIKNYSIIVRIHDFLKWYLENNAEERANGELDLQYHSALWESYVNQTYEKYRASTSVFNKILYEQLLNDLLWNPLVDPYDERVIEVNTAKLKEKDSNVHQYMNEGVKEIVNKVKEKLDPNQYKYDIDEDGKILVKKNFKADLFRYYSSSNRLLKLYKRQERVEEMKLELAKLFFINELIEIKYVYNNEISVKEKEDYKKYTDLRANVLSSFKTYMEFILAQDAEFDFNHYYEHSPYANVLEIKREQIKGARNLIKLLLTGH